MADYTLTARPSGSSQDNNATRVISTYFHYDAAQHKTISSVTRKDGIWCSCGGASQSVVLNGYDRLIDTKTGEVVKKSNTGSCTCRGTGPSSENYMTTSFTDWTQDESNLAVTLWAAGRLKITRTVWIKSYTSADHGTPTFRDGYYNDDITIKGSTIPFTYYAPTVVKFEVMRSADGVTPDDMTPIVWAKIRLAMEDTSGLSDNPALNLRHSTYQSMSGYDVKQLTSIPIANYITAEQSIKLGYAYSIGSNHYFQLEFVAGDESSPFASASVGMVNVPIHINANNHGVSVGGYSNATPTDERFESMWQAFFHAGIAGVTNYITDEIPTGGKWIDGKPIYRKVINTGNLTTGSHDISDNVPQDVDTLISLRGMGYRTNPRWQTIPSAATANINQNIEVFYAGRTGGYVIHINIGSGLSALTQSFCVMEYTKTETMSATAALRMITGGANYSNDVGEQLSDEQALNIITGGET